MNDTNSQDSDNGLPEGIPAPPPPKPNILDPKNAGPTYAFGTNDATRSRNAKERSHPTDPYQPLKNKRGCGGCCGCLGGSLVVWLLLFIALVAAVVLYGPGRFVKEGYTVVNLGRSESEVTTAPTEPTLYIGEIVTYSVGVTEVPIAIIGKDVVIGGSFRGDVSVTGAKVTALPNANFAGDLEVFAAEFFDKGITLTGELKGRVMKSLQ